jgi:hypothetical protein
MGLSIPAVNQFNIGELMKKLSTISVLLIFVISLFICSCTASGKVTVQKQQTRSTFNNVK